jgi:hypothetical protein
VSPTIPFFKDGKYSETSTVRYNTLVSFKRHEANYASSRYSL